MDLSRRAVGGIVPTRAERPADAAELAALVGAAARAGEAVVLWGGGTRIDVGDAPRRYDIALDLTGLGGIVEHAPADLVCTVRAGTSVAALQSALARSGQRWPVNAADPARATVGGTIASAAPDPSRLRHSHPRDWVIGCEAVLGDGTRVRAGGRVVKNVTGYDLTRLYSGTYGTLAALAEVSLKLVALDEATRVLRVTADDLARAALDLRASLPFDGIVLVGGMEPALYVRVAGSEAAVRRVVDEVARRARCDDAADGTWERLVDRPAAAERAARVAVPPGHEPEHLAGDAMAYVGAGTVYRFGGSPAELRAGRERAEAAGGALVLERASPDDRRSLGAWGRSRVPAAIAEGLRRRFDPHGVFAPGRVP